LFWQILPDVVHIVLRSRDTTATALNPQYQQFVAKRPSRAWSTAYGAKDKHPKPKITSSIQRRLDERTVFGPNHKLNRHLPSF